MTSVAAPRTWRGSAQAYIALTKPKIIRLLLITTVPTMFVAAGGWPDFWLVLATLVGGSLAAGSANAFNCWADRDIDARMRRTSQRPLVLDAVAPERALLFGALLGVASFVWLTALVNLLAAALALAANAFYVGVYTLWLKRRSTQNIVIGGAAGCMPVLVGWAAVTGTVELPAILLFAIVYYWTPPHFWALALRYREDYANAGVPMLPVVVGVAETTRQIRLYSVLLVAVSLMFGAVAEMGLLYLATAVVLGWMLLARAQRLRREQTEAVAMGLFHFSITYLGVLFAVMAVDAVI
ncbi:MAG: heme o synthase [Egibacteraceae bacterium]